MMKNKKTEAEFADLFLAQLDKLAIFKAYPVVFQELSTSSNGIPDAILLNNEDQQALVSFAKKFPGIELTNAHAAIISKLYPKRFSSFEIVTRKSGLSPQYVTKVLSDLNKSSAIEFRLINNKKYYRLKEDFYVPYVELMSIEFKLDDWKSALRQALRYKAFSGKSCVVMPSSKRKVLVDNAEIFKSFGIGLALYDYSNSSIEIIVKPKRFQVGTKPSYTDALGRLVSLSSSMQPA